MPQQVARAYRAFSVAGLPIAQHINLRALQDENETVFYALLAAHVDELLPIVYTPTVGEACQHFSEIYRRPRGLFVGYPDRHRLRAIIADRPRRDVDVIVVTDGQRILGLGDQGIGGVGIPIGKLSLYTALGGIDPARTLPIVLDVGTDNPDLLADPMYLGRPHRRVTGQTYLDFVDAFVQAVRAELPDVLLQWEDFASVHAKPILERYRDQLLTFNDDIQGTAAVAVAAMTAGARLAGSRLVDQTVVMLGAGSAGIGVCEQLVRAMVDDGMTETAALQRISVLDVHGLLTSDRTDLTDAQRRLASPPGDATTLLEVVRAVRPTILVGLSTATGAFNQDVVTAMAAHCDRPVILPLSNPTANSEARPQDLADWTGGRALVATGSPFPPMQVGGDTIPVAQCNNVYVFPGIGLAVTAVRARRVTDAMMTAAAKAVGSNDTGTRALLPPRTELAATATRVAVAVAQAAIADGVAEPVDDVEATVAAARWVPGYPA